MAHRFGALLVERAELRAFDEGLQAVLPADASEVDDLRVWLSWCDLGRTNEGVGNAVADVEGREHWLMIGLLAREHLATTGREPSPEPSPGAPAIQTLARLDEPHQLAVMASAQDALTIVHGIRYRLCATPSALTAQDARQTADRLLSRARAA